MIHIVLPAYNEETGLSRLLPAIDAALAGSPEPHRIIVVDDGSDDGTARVAGDFGSSVRLIRHSSNRGLGQTLRDGLSAALAQAADDQVIVTLDADDSHDPAVIPSMVRKIRDGCDVVIASRFQPGSTTRGVGALRTTTSWGASALMRVALPTPGVRDFTCGFRAYRAGVLRDAIRIDPERFARMSGFECMVDVLLQLRRRGATFAEVPMVLRYDRKESASRMRVWRTIADTLRLIARELLSPA
jgi:dolichol-phosphate mannosyltransferase